MAKEIQDGGPPRAGSSSLRLLQGFQFYSHIYYPTNLPTPTLVDTLSLDMYIETYHHQHHCYRHNLDLMEPCCQVLLL